MRLKHKGILFGVCALLLPAIGFGQSQSLLTTVSGRSPLSQAAGPVQSQRLSEIAAALKEGKSDGAALLTEAARLCGFEIWTEDRAKLMDSLVQPGLGLAVTDKEISAYAQMFKRGDRIAMADLVAGFRVIHDEIGDETSMDLYIDRLVRRNLFEGKAAQRNLAAFLQDLASTHDEPGDVPLSMTTNLDAIQALLVMRVISEELGGGLRKAARQNPETYASARAVPAQDEGPGWAQDAFAGGITGLWEKVVEKLGTGGQKATNAVGKANALSAISKFIMTYQFLKGEMRLEGRGQPLIRTKDFDAGDERTTVVRFYIDGAGITDWLKDNRKYFHTLGLDLDTPKSGPLAKIETFWEVGQSRKYATKQLIQAVRGTTNLARLKTDENGEARVTWEGKPQPKKIDPKKAMPVMKSVWISATPQAKSVEMQQDLVDAVMGAMGIRSGPAGMITPIMEMLYRMKWNCPAHFELQVRDWVEGETFGQLTVEARGSGFSYSRENTVKMSIDHTFTISDYEMQVLGGEAMPAIDPETLKRMPPDVRKQMEAGMKQMAELAKRRQFQGMGPGTGTLSINDSSLQQFVEISCGESVVEISNTWRGAETKTLEPFMGPFTFAVTANLESKQAVVNFGGQIEGLHSYRAGRKSGSDKTKLTFMDRIEIDPASLDKDRNIIVPLKETPLPGQNASNYYGAATIKFKFGPKNMFTGSMIISYSVTRKIPPKDE